MFPILGISLALSGLKMGQWYMRWNYRKRFKLGPMRVNVSRNGLGTSWGIRGFRVTNSSTGQRYLTLSLPGTGLSWRKTLGRSQRSRVLRTGAVPSLPSTVQAPQQPPAPPSPPTTTGTSAPPLVNGMPWWKQTGIRKGP
jgi:hypothetical protein